MTLFAITENELKAIEKRSYSLYNAVLKQATEEMDNRFSREEKILLAWRKVCRAKTIWIKFYDLKMELRES